jgi:uncharacterized protein
MAAQDFVLALLATEDIPSRTMLQKLVYLAADQAGEDVPFAPHYYGPYSPELQDEIDELVAAGWVAETAAQLEPWQPTPFDVVQYRYRLTALGRAEVERITPRIRDTAARVIEAAHDARAWNQASLSVAAKLHHIRRIDAGIGAEAVPEVARQFGWRITEPEARRGAALLERLVGGHGREPAR